MKREMECVNFEAPENLAVFMRESLSDLQHLSPSDSYVETSIRKEDQGFSMRISIKHAEGFFSSEKRGSDLRQIVEQCCQDVTNQVTVWKKLRFAEFPTVGSAEKSAMYEGNVKRLKPLNILVVDDDIDSVLPLEICLKKFNCKVKLVSTGYEAIHELLSEGQKYDVIILDWAMPDLNGRQTLINAQQIISGIPSFMDHWEKTQIPVITFSSYHPDQVDLPHCKNFKFLEHWEKPSDRWQLLEKVSNTFRDWS